MELKDLVNIWQGQGQKCFLKFFWIGREFVARHLVPFGICYELEEKKKCRTSIHSLKKNGMRTEERHVGRNQRNVWWFSQGVAILSLSCQRSEPFFGKGGLLQINDSARSCLSGKSARRTRDSQWDTSWSCLSGDLSFPPGEGANRCQPPQTSGQLFLLLC